MENMDKKLAVTKWVLIVQQKKPQMPQKISAQAQKFQIFEKKLSLGVRGQILFKISVISILLTFMYLVSINLSKNNSLK